jgi:hypothetical protein
VQIVKVGMKRILPANLQPFSRPDGPWPFFRIEKPDCCALDGGRQHLEILSYSSLGNYLET